MRMLWYDSLLGQGLKNSAQEDKKNRPQVQILILEFELSYVLLVRGFNSGQKSMIFILKGYFKNCLNWHKRKEDGVKNLR